MGLTVKTVKDDRALMDAIAIQVKQMDKLVAYVGLAGDVGNHAGSGIQMAAMAMIHEYGSPSQNIASRPFMRTTADSPRIRGNVKRLSDKVTGKILDGSLTAKQGIMQLADYYVGQTKKTLRDGPWQALKRKRPDGSDRPLNDTGQLRNSITYRLGTK